MSCILSRNVQKCNWEHGDGLVRERQGRIRKILWSERVLVEGLLAARVSVACWPPQFLFRPHTTSSRSLLQCSLRRTPHSLSLQPVLALVLLLLLLQ